MVGKQKISDCFSVAIQVWQQSHELIGKGVTHYGSFDKNSGLIDGDSYESRIIGGGNFKNYVHLIKKVKEESAIKGYSSVIDACKKPE